MCHPFFLPLLLVALAGAVTAGAVPRVPGDDAEVLERVEAPRAAYIAELRALRLELAANPDDAPRAFAFVRRALRATRTSGDPRPLGQAEAVLAPFVAVPEPATLLLVVGGLLALAQSQRKTRPGDATARCCSIE